MMTEWFGGAVAQRLSPSIVVVSTILAISLLAPPRLPADSVNNQQRTVTRLAEGVYEIRHPDAPDGFPQGNTTVIIGERGVLVVDSCFLPSSAGLDVEQIRKWTDKPVIYLVNTHWHFDHTLGNATYVAAFPSIQIIAQKETQKLIRDVNPGALARYPEREERTKKALATGKKSDGTPLTEGERKRYEKRLAGLMPTLEELRTAVQFVPNVSFDHELNIDLGHRPVQIRFLGRGNTVGDTIVYLPSEKILATGDLLDHPVTYLFGDISVDHVNTLQLMAQLDVETIVPGHGEVLQGKDYMYQVIDFLKAVNTEVEKEINAGAGTPEEVELILPKAIDIDKWRDKFAGNDATNRNFFDVNFHSLIASAFQQIDLR
jgi:glyoxylase-like metal-dependent hydrolase (beta-lactamase superfamily II)